MIGRGLAHQRQLKALIRQQPTATAAATTYIRTDPLTESLRIAADFRQLNVRLMDKTFGKSFAYLNGLGGNTIHDFFSRILAAVFEDEMSLHVNSEGKKSEQNLQDSKFNE
ncbi:unnamed protein product [Dibothriocephalus latus]|uniref:Uncharacterized protein n=1 Tax=Dibothriocephalus latus TaxID=60516 RepID=A0A3P6RD56_DIBLA|nr:unnamed protein product [Dibothriocephalus latus]